MYVAKQFSVEATQALEMAERIGVGDFITSSPRGLDVTFLPFNLVHDDAGYALHTHLAAINTQWRDEGPGMVVVHGPDSYISPTQMPRDDPAAPLPHVPTWDYLTIHMTGTMIAHHDSEWKMNSLRELVDRHEPTWRIEHVSLAKIEAMLPALVGLEFRIDQVLGKAKFNQSFSSDDLANLALSLRHHGHSAETADLIEQLAIPYARQREERVARAEAIARERKSHTP